jgi:hypothetical protein
MTEDQQTQLIELGHRLMAEAEKPMSADRLEVVHQMIWFALRLVDGTGHRTEPVRDAKSGG